VTTHIIAAICTPLGADDTLRVGGLEAHIEQQWRAGISGLLVAGTMGRMQLLADDTYLQLARHSVRISAGRGEVMVGVGDTSFARMRDRIRMVEQMDVDGLVVLTPYFMPYTQDELIDYYTALADISRKPLFLYKLPSLTGAGLSVETVLQVSKHPNIHGIKCSCSLEWVRELMGRADDGFRVIVARANEVDSLVLAGMKEQLDGIYALAPEWTVNIVNAAESGDVEPAAEWQHKLSSLLRVVTQDYPMMPAFTVILNALGIPGNFSPAPIRPLTDEQREHLLNIPVVKELLRTTAESAAAPQA